MKEKLKLILEKNGIFFEEVDEIIDNDQCIVMPIKIKNELYFFKFLDKEMYNKICLEVNIVNKLNEKGIGVHNYYNLNGISAFQTDEICFYGTKYVGNNSMILNYSYDLLCDVILSIAKMHNQLIKIPYNEFEGTLNKSNDYIELKKFFESHKDFIYENNFNLYVDSILENGFDISNYSFIHYDLNFKNIMIDNNKFSGFIDFTDFKIGYIEDDLGKFFQNVIYIESITNEDINNLIKLYNNNSLIELSLKNLKISIIYRIIYRYFCALNENSIDDKYNESTQKVLKRITDL